MTALAQGAHWASVEDSGESRADLQSDPGNKGPQQPPRAGHGFRQEDQQPPPPLAYSAK